MSEPRPYSLDDVRIRVKERLGEPGRAVGDHSFNPEIAELFSSIERQPAAVLVPVVDRRPEATLLLTARAAGLRAHSGEIAFPGGRIDRTDAGPEAAALREAAEEIGLEASFVEPLGRGPDYLTGSGYHIIPVIAAVRPGFRLALNPEEVADAFEVPLSFLMSPANHRTATRKWRGAERRYFEMPYSGRHIWGVTAGILRVLYERLYADTAESLP